MLERRCIAVAGRPIARPDEAAHAQRKRAGHGHAHGHRHGHGHGDAEGRGAKRADHGPPAGGTAARALWLALALTATFGLIEAASGWLAGSLALISDAGHMATDAAGLVIALIAQAVAQRPPSRRASYGYARAEVLAAFINALTMLALVVWIAVEAVSRLLAPTPVRGPVVIAVALLGLAVNGIVAWLLARESSSINARGAFLHVIGDLLGSVAALIAGAVIQFTGWLPIDPLLSLVVVVLIMRSTWELLRQATGVLMERVPAHLSYEAIGRALASLPGVSGVHDLHVWAMTAERVALSAHVTIADGTRWLATLAAAQLMLRRDFGIDHVTLQPSWAEMPADRRVIPVTPASGTDERRLH